MSSPVLPQAAGYGVVIGMGLVFSMVMLGVTRLQARYTSHAPSSSEEFSSASRSVPPGLIAAGIVSAWTWAATLLQSSATAYKFGISGPWWYASGATIQILLFAMIASKLKQNAPNCHTYLEIMRVRWGKAAHLTFLFFGLATNIIVSTMLILGGSATVTDLTGMNTVAACFLIPLGVSIYVLAGGMRATLIADWSHTLVLYCILIAFALTVYATSDKLGSPAVVWEHLSQASINHPVEGNAQGSYLTMRSKSGLIFGVMNIVGNFGTVFADQAYFQRAIASSPSTSVKAFLLGGLAWFGIPMGIATSMGLAAVALSRGDNPIMSLTSSEVSAGLPAVKAAAALMGQSGAVAMLILLFLAVTSACSAEQIAVSSLFTYDVYGEYINKKATDKQLLWAGRGAILGCSIMMGVFATAFHYIGVSMGYLYELMGTMIGSAVVPIAVCITWRKANGTGAVVGAIAGFVAGVAGWLGLTASLNGGVVNVDTTFGDYEMLTGNLLAIGVGGIVTVTWSLIKPCDFDWEATRAINRKVAESQVEVMGTTPQDSPSLDAETPGVKEKMGNEAVLGQQVAAEGSAGAEAQISAEDEEERLGLQKAFRFAAWAALILVFVLIFAIPLPLFFTSYVYPQQGFAAWVGISITWLFVGLLLVGVYPVFEARHGLTSVWKGFMTDVKSRRK